MCMTDIQRCRAYTVIMYQHHTGCISNWIAKGNRGVMKKSAKDQEKNMTAVPVFKKETVSWDCSHY